MPEQYSALTELTGSKYVTHRKKEPLKLAQKPERQFNRAAVKLYKLTHPRVTERELAEIGGVRQQTASAWTRGICLPEPSKRKLIQKRFPHITDEDWLTKARTPRGFLARKKPITKKPARRRKRVRR